MINNYKTILFTSNLSENSRNAFYHAAMLATQFKAKIFLLHVLERMPESIEARISGLFGEEQWQLILKKFMEDARQILVGKVTSRLMIRAAMSEFCRESGIKDDSCGYVENEILIRDGNVVEEILEQSRKRDCNIIVMGASKGLLSGTSIGSNIRNVIKKSDMPVLVIPPNR